MIFDNIKNAHIYCACHPKFQQAFEFIKKVFDENLPAGRYDLDGELLYAFVQEYSAKSENEGVLESHKNYIDIQFISEGTEVIYASDVSLLTVKQDYDAEKDIMLLEDCEKASKAVLQKGEYGIFFPWDAHKPGLCYGGKPGNVKKIVVKVRAI